MYIWCVLRRKKDTYRKPKSNGNSVILNANKDPITCSCTMTPSIFYPITRFHYLSVLKQYQIAIQNKLKAIKRLHIFAKAFHEKFHSNIALAHLTVVMYAWIGTLRHFSLAEFRNPVLLNSQGTRLLGAKYNIFP